jgi:hypothetical protein
LPTPHGNGRSRGLIGHTALCGALAASTLIAGCSDELTRPDVAQNRRLNSVQPARRLPPNNLHEHFLELAARIPGFGGMFFDSSGAIVVRLKDLTKADLARAAVAEIAASGKALGLTPAVPVKTVDAEYSYDELASLYANVLGIPNLGVTSYDIDERINRIVIGVPKSRARGDVESLLAGHGVPAGPVVLVDAEPPTNLTTLQQYYRPLVGGQRIRFVRQGQTGNCTQGYNVELRKPDGSYEPNHCFVTNAHCSGNFGIIDGTVYGQPSLSYGTVPGSVEGLR